LTLHHNTTCVTLKRSYWRNRESNTQR